MKDQYANYVVQKILDTCSDQQREVLIGRIRASLSSLRKFTYGKHIVARVEQLMSEGAPNILSLFLIKQPNHSLLFSSLLFYIMIMIECTTTI